MTDARAEQYLYTTSFPCRYQEIFAPPPLPDHLTLSELVATADTHLFSQIVGNPIIHPIPKTVPPLSCADFRPIYIYHSYPVSHS